jgi:hypothetical protein
LLILQLELAKTDSHYTCYLMVQTLCNSIMVVVFDGDGALRTAVRGEFVFRYPATPVRGVAVLEPEVLNADAIDGHHGAAAAEDSDDEDNGYLEFLSGNVKLPDTLPASALHWLDDSQKILSDESAFNNSRDWRDCSTSTLALSSYSSSSGYDSGSDCGSDYRSGWRSRNDSSNSSFSSSSGETVGIIDEGVGPNAPNEPDDHLFERGMNQLAGRGSCRVHTV